MVLLVTIFQNLGPNELADFKLGKPISTIPSGKHFGFGKSPKLEGEINILQESRILLEIQFFFSNSEKKYFFSAILALSLFKNPPPPLHQHFIPPPQRPKPAFSWALTDLKHFGRLKRKMGGRNSQEGEK